MSGILEDLFTQLQRVERQLEELRPALATLAAQHTQAPGASAPAPAPAPAAESLYAPSAAFGPAPAPAPAPAPRPPAAPAPSPQAVPTLPDLRARFTRLNQTQGAEVCLTLLQKYGVPKISQVPPDQYVNLAADLQQRGV